MYRDPELDRRIANVLAKLATLSEVPAASIDVTQAKDAEGHDLPGGVSVRHRDPDKPPPLDRSLYDYFAFMFARCTTDAERRLWLYLAEDAYANRVSRPPDQRAAGTLKQKREGTEDRDHRIIEWYEGVDSLRAAIAESSHAGYCSEANVRKVRRDARRNPDNGHRLPGWAGWSDEERVKAINSWRAKGVTSPTAIAAELGTRRQSVERYVGGYRRRRDTARR